jgi:hypothetical protein
MDGDIAINLPQQNHPLHLQFSAKQLRPLAPVSGGFNEDSVAADVNSNASTPVESSVTNSTISINIASVNVNIRFSAVTGRKREVWWIYE